MFLGFSIIEHFVTATCDRNNISQYYCIMVIWSPGQKHFKEILSTPNIWSVVFINYKVIRTPIQTLFIERPFLLLFWMLFIILDSLLLIYFHRTWFMGLFLCFLHTLLHHHSVKRSLNQATTHSNCVSICDFCIHDINEQRCN